MSWILPEQWFPDGNHFFGWFPVTTLFKRYEDMQEKIQQAIENATDEQKSRYGLDPKFLQFAFNTSRSGSLQVNMDGMKETRPTDEDKSRFLLTICDIAREAGIELSVSHGGKKTVETKNGNETFYSCWPSLWYNTQNAQAAEAKQEAAALKAEVTDLKAQMAQMIALMQAQANSAEQGTPVP